MSDNETETTRLVGTGWDKDGNDTAQSVLTGDKQKVRALALTTPNLVVPILFVPGIMGSRLKVKDRSKGAAWFPPEGTVDGIVMLLKHLNKSSAERQILLDPNNTEVDDNGPAKPDASSRALLAIAEGKTDAERAKWRGWGQVMGASYGGILSLLEKTLAIIFDPASQGKLLATTWKTLVMAQQDAARLGAQKPFQPLTETQLQDAADVLYPVHAVGYNWLQSNQSSGERLAQEIKRITAHYQSKGKCCDKVIVVTHSMGGLVARACARLPGMDQQILGIVHGVMPAVGAPATYKRFRAGWEGAEQMILGRNAADCTAVMANAPGPLELLPTPQYKTNGKDGPRHWLRASHPTTDSEGQPHEADVLLGDGDTYADIYLNNSASWWKLVKEELIDPAGRLKREKAIKEGKEPVEDDHVSSDFAKFADNMSIAIKLHKAIEDQYHANSFVYYAADPKHPAWNEVHWKCDKEFHGDLKTALVAEDDFDGRVHLTLPDSKEENPVVKAAPDKAQPSSQLGPELTPPVVEVRAKSKPSASKKQIKYAFDVQKGSGPGDGTVPEESGAAPTAHVVQIFRHEGKSKGHESYDHQGSYNAKIAQSVTLYSIAKMVAESEWLKQNLSKQ